MNLPLWGVWVAAFALAFAALLLEERVHNWRHDRRARRR